MALVKKALHLFLNASLSAALAFLLRSFFFLPPYVDRLFRQLDLLRPSVLQYVRQKGFDKRDTVPRNEMYFCLEYLEQTFVRKFAELLCADTQVTSLV